ncbi:MAG TPA: CRTAC1 family protein [Bryobacteraceae bacterium]|nr:CRTAC1 family protein [Bryobacteraceae bacterium]
MTRTLLWPLLAGLSFSAAVAAFQGMAVPKRPTAPVKPVETNLPPIQVNFRDMAEEAGLTAVNVSGPAENKKYILEATGNGVVIFDYDNDGLPDIYVPNATVLDDAKPQPPPTGHLYRNLGKLKFRDVTAEAGLSVTGWGQGACAADFDNDGFRDLFVTFYGQSRLFRNLGDGKFGDVTAQAGLQVKDRRWDSGCSFVDYDLDGDLDLAVTSYLDFDREKTPVPGADSRCRWKGLAVMCGPLGLPLARNRFFRNDGKGSFTDVSLASGFGNPLRCYAFTVSAADFDGDRYPDLYVACDSTPSLLYRNRRDGTFEEIGIASGAALNEDGQEQAGMGVAVADYDNDGDLDIAKTNFSDDAPNLYRNDGSNVFTDTSVRSGLAVNTQYLGWGIQFVDVDHDGLKELFMANGHVYPEVDTLKISERYRQARLLYWNVGGGKFKDISKTSGDGITQAWSSRGAAAGDLDNDGTVEIVVSNMGGRPSLLKNFGQTKHWLLVQCVGTKSNRDAVGARVMLLQGARRFTAEVLTGSSFLSQNDSRLHFGLGGDATYSGIEVLWPSGLRERFTGGAGDKLVVLKEGSGQLAK